MQKLENLFSFLVNNASSMVSVTGIVKYLFPTSGYGRGYALEGIVYMALVRNGYRVNTGVLYNSEVDFVATTSKRTLYVQVAYSIGDPTTAEREYRAFKAIKGEGEKLLVTMDDEPFPVRDGVHHLQAWTLEDILMTGFQLR